jgi:ATP-dependent DNA helicase RecG
VLDIEDADKLLIFCQGTRTIAEMLSYMSYSDRTKFRKKYIYPLLDAEIIQMTIPNKPNSRNQKYQLTAKGLDLMEHLKRNK